MSNVFQIMHNILRVEVKNEYAFCVLPDMYVPIERITNLIVKINNENDRDNKIKDYLNIGQILFVRVNNAVTLNELRKLGSSVSATELKALNTAFTVLRKLLDHVEATAVPNGSALKKEISRAWEHGAVGTFSSRWYCLH